MRTAVNYWRYSIRLRIWMCEWKIEVILIKTPYWLVNLNFAIQFAKLFVFGLKNEIHGQFRLLLLRRCIAGYGWLAPIFLFSSGPVVDNTLGSVTGMCLILSVWYIHTRSQKNGFFQWQGSICMWNRPNRTDLDKQLVWFRPSFDLRIT